MNVTAQPSRFDGTAQQVYVTKYWTHKQTPRSQELGHQIAWSELFVHIAKFCFKGRERIKLQGVNRRFYRKVAQWMKKVNRKRNYRLSKAACLKGSGPVFEFPSAAMVKKMLYKNSALDTLVGFENNAEDGDGPAFNFVFDNGTRSTQRDGEWPYNDFMIPADALN